MLSQCLRFLVLLLVGAVMSQVAVSPVEAARRRPSHEPLGFQTFTSPQANPLALSPDGTRLYVVNTTSDTVDVIDTSANLVIRTIPVGMAPVSIAVRPDGNEVWVSNHVSDTVSVIDTTDPSFPLVATIQELDAMGSTLFDEPVGIAFASNSKAYVALSSRNQIAVIDVVTRLVTNRLNIRAQEPRAIAVQNGLLYVAAFESGNQSEVSVCATLFGTGIVGDQCSLGLVDVVTFAGDPNIPGAVKNIVVDSDVPDRDLFVFDTTTDLEVDDVSGVGTLLYGLAVDSTGRAWISQVDALNAVNGDHGDNLVDLDNRMFTNEIARVDCSGGGSCSFVHGSDVLDLEPGSPDHSTALATPYGIAISADDSTLVVTAAHSSRVFTVDTASFSLSDTLDLAPAGVDFGQQIPKGVALLSDGGGAPQTAYILNTLENTVSVVDVSTPSAISEGVEISVGNDPTPAEVRRGRIAFVNAFASDTGTFSCGGCHPDGNTDQLLWRIGGACSFGACTGDDEIRSTMPIRGLKGTLPLHWDGTLGDPFGGGNGAVGVGGAGGTDCVLGDADGDHDCFVDLADEALAGVMCDQNPVSNPGGCPLGGNQLSVAEIDDMAFFLAAVAYPPARGRRSDDSLSMIGDGVMRTDPDGLNGIEVSAFDGFADYYMDQNGNGSPSTCADMANGCHALPLGAGTNSSTLNGFDAPTWRGATDRFLQFSMGLTNAEELLVLANAGLSFPPLFGAGPLEAPLQWDPNQGFREITTLGMAFIAFEAVYGTRPLDTFQMFEEASTGHSGALGRQLTLDTTTAFLADTITLMTELEVADDNGYVNLRAVGTRNGGDITLSFRGNGTYQSGNLQLGPAALRAEAAAGTTRVTLTAGLRQNVGNTSFPQPLLSVILSGTGPTGNPALPTTNPMSFLVSGVRNNSTIVVDGQPADGTVVCVGGSFSPFCGTGIVTVTLNSTPADGQHLVQLQSPAGLMSNEIPICLGPVAGCL